MHPELVPSLLQKVTFQHRTSVNGFGEPTAEQVIIKAFVELNHSRRITIDGEVTTTDGMVFIDYQDYVNLRVEAGDMVLLPDGTKRTVRMVEKLYDLDGQPDHLEVTF